MPADALSIRVHEVVFGKCPHPSDQTEQWSFEDGNDYESGIKCNHCGSHDIVYHDPVPDYSRSMNAVVLVMAEVGIGVRPATRVGGVEGEIDWMAYMIGSARMDDTIWDRAPSRAICLLALKVKGVEFDGGG